jgi:hypothetical protein
MNGKHTQLDRLARRNGKQRLTPEKLILQFPEGTRILFAADGGADIGVVRGWDIDGVGRVYLTLAGGRTVYPAEVTQTLSQAQVRELYAYALQNNGRLPRWTYVEAE